MRTAGVIAVAAGFGLLLQTTVLQALPFGQPAPDVLLVLCVYLGLYHHSAGGALGAFLLGYLQDSVSGSATGLNAFAMVSVFLLVHLTCRRLWVDNMLSKVVVVFLGSLIKMVALVILLATFLVFDDSWSTVAWSLVVHGTLAAAIAPPLFALLASARFYEEREAG